MGGVTLVKSQRVELSIGELETVVFNVSRISVFNEMFLIVILLEITRQYTKNHGGVRRGFGHSLS